MLYLYKVLNLLGYVWVIKSSASKLRKSFMFTIGIPLFMNAIHSKYSKTLLGSKELSIV